jgi:predicted Fe-Mo cluster-binding NifX family protein
MFHFCYTSPSSPVVVISSIHPDYYNLHIFVLLALILHITKAGGEPYMKVAIPRHGEEVTPCFEYTDGITIYEIHKNRVVAQTDFTLRSREELDRVRLLKDQGVSVLICSGIQAAHEDLLTTSGIQVISWVSGKANEVLLLFLENTLVSHSDRYEAQDAETPKN